ncbi:hypothetical protein DASC09_042860 [Saccharomycopsis crataegensis]|uniref:Cyclin N-terminal domain-containing protein n=1 Tax=Saccharomycopsis crataegensis TaxID=43959 RepID=A0AAV5QQW5_9ASCO|nr:hypothetical protein DASC09_042860 [Saccharomycopsis crataegensis]
MNCSQPSSPIRKILTATTNRYFQNEELCHHSSFFHQMFSPTSNSGAYRPASLTHNDLRPIHGLGFLLQHLNDLIFLNSITSPDSKKRTIAENEDDINTPKARIGGFCDRVTSYTNVDSQRSTLLNTSLCSIQAPTTTLSTSNGQHSGGTTANDPLQSSSEIFVGSKPASKVLFPNTDYNNSTSVVPSATVEVVASCISAPVSPKTKIKKIVTPSYLSPTDYPLILDDFKLPSTPTLSLEKFLERIHNIVNIDIECYIAASIYLRRLFFNPDLLPDISDGCNSLKHISNFIANQSVKLDEINVFKLVSSAIRVAEKLLQDNHSSETQFWEAAGWNSTNPANHRLEVNLMKLLRYELFFDYKDLDCQLNDIRKIRWEVEKLKNSQRVETGTSPKNAPVTFISQNHLKQTPQIYSTDNFRYKLPPLQSQQSHSFPKFEIDLPLYPQTRCFSQPHSQLKIQSRCLSQSAQGRPSSQPKICGISRPQTHSGEAETYHYHRHSPYPRQREKTPCGSLSQERPQVFVSREASPESQLQSEHSPLQLSLDQNDETCDDKPRCKKYHKYQFNPLVSQNFPPKLS